MMDADVFAALVRVMHRRGPAELTLREIAAEAGVTAGALVQRFGSMRAMLLAHAPFGILPVFTTTWPIRSCIVTC